ncbi:MAG: glycosyltransferase family 4 protein [Alphaproteobacteria bacterium]|nr:glycosyltransferase family 4 protein [Alphaproteobacteria bacterium]
MKVLQLLPAMQGGGVERGTIEIASAMQKEHIENLVVSAGGRLVPELKKAGVLHIALDVGSKNPLKWIKNIRALRRIIQDEKVTIVHARSRIPAWIAHFALKKCPNVKFLTTFHGKYGTKPEWFKIPYNKIMVSGDKVISISNFISQHIKETYHVSDEKIRLIYRGADTNKFDPVLVSSLQIEELIKKWQVPADKPVILMPGRLSRMKGHLVVLDALKQMKHKNVTCIFVGSAHGKSEFRDELQQKINALDGQTTVLLLEHCDQMPTAYTISSVVLSASLYPEAFGRTITEAQSMERIVVATAHGGALETIEDGKTGFLVPVGDATALAETLDKVLDMPVSQREQIGKDAAASVFQNFSIEQMCQKTLAVYRELDAEK